MKLTNNKPYRALMLFGFNFAAWQKYAFANSMLSKPPYIIKHNLHKFFYIDYIIFKNKVYSVNVTFFKLN